MAAAWIKVEDAMGLLGDKQGTQLQVRFYDYNAHLI